MSNSSNNAPAFLVLTVIGDDRPGLVGELAAVVAEHHGNWLESSMAQLAGKFAGIVKIGVAQPQAAKLQQALLKINQLKITVEVSESSQLVLATRRLKLALVGNDRIGIVKEVSQVLARHAVNVENLDTHTSSAPMSADTLFHAIAELTAAASLDASALTRELERISNDLMVDITLDESISH